MHMNTAIINVVHRKEFDLQPKQWVHKPAHFFKLIKFLFILLLLDLIISLLTILPVSLKVHPNQLVAHQISFQLFFLIFILLRNEPRPARPKPLLKNTRGPIPYSGSCEDEVFQIIDINVNRSSDLNFIQDNFTCQSRIL